MSIPEDNHYNPQFYLRSWREGIGKVPYFTRRNGRVVLSSVAPKNTGFVKNLYSLVKVPEEKKQIIETDFLSREVDDKAAPIFRKLQEEGVKNLSKKDRIFWTRFLIASRLRVPDLVNDLRKSGPEELKKNLEQETEVYLEERSEAPEETLREYVENHFVGLIDNFGMIMLPELITDPEHSEIIATMFWWVEDVSKANVPLLTSDRPLWVSTGLKKPKCLLALPLSPTKLFLATHDRPLMRSLHQLSPNQLVRRSNESIVGQAVEYIYGKSEISFIERRLRHFKNPI